MKVGILTFHHALNCGAVLQAWALQTYLRKAGVDASIVNYGRIGWPNRWRLNARSIRALIGSVRRLLPTVFIEPYRRRLYRRFLRQTVGIGNAVSKDGINKQGYTHLVTGSDQVWHPAINEGDETYFLANAMEGVKRISYAPSFGVDAFADKLERKMAEWLTRFDSLSVREPQGAQIVSRLCGRPARVVCDPTLLLERTDYEKIEQCPRGLPDRYVAVYTVCGHPWAEKEAIKIGKKFGLPVVHLPGGQPARWYWARGVRRVSAFGPAEWLWFIRHAEFVVTNSFHGTVFSLLFHRPFLVALNGKASDARMLTLLSGTGLEILAVEKVNEVSDAMLDVQWALVDAQLQKLAKTGKDFLGNALA